MRVKDQSNPEKETTVPVQIVVSRDQFPPVIDFPTYQKTIDENERVNNTVITRIVAHDQDLKVCPTSLLVIAWQYTYVYFSTFSHV